MGSIPNTVSFFKGLIQEITCGEQGEKHMKTNVKIRPLIICFLF
jgi:hypothetical protein